MQTTLAGRFARFVTTALAAALVMYGTAGVARADAPKKGGETATALAQSSAQPAAPAQVPTPKAKPAAKPHAKAKTKAKTTAKPHAKAKTKVASKTHAPAAKHKPAPAKKK